MPKTILLAIITVILLSSAAFGASLDGRLGLTGKAGAVVPVKDDFINGTSESRTGLVYGGGLIFGFTKNLAAEIDVNRAPKIDVEIGGKKSHEASLTDIGVGIQYRLFPESRLVPFFGIGADFIRGSMEQTVTNATYDLDWTEGGHVSAGVDYFVAYGVAFSAEARYVAGFKGDIKREGSVTGRYDPMHFSATIGLRLILPHSAFE